MPQPQIFAGIAPAPGGRLDVNDADGLRGYVDHVYLTEGKPAKARLVMGRLAAAGADRERPQAERDAATAAAAQLRGHVDANYRDFESPGARNVPRQVHFVWFGRQPSDAALANLEAWSARAAEANQNLPAGAEPWSVNVWTDPGTARWGGTSGWDQAVVGRLEQAGVRLRVESADVVAERSGRGLEHGDPGRLAGVWSTSLENRAFNLASDVTRYAVLEKYGGIYADVDIAPGGLSLERVADVRMAVDDLPLLAPQLRDEAAVNRILGHDIDAVIGPDDLRAAAAAQYDVGDFNNNFIVTPPGSTFISSMSDTVPTVYDNYRDTYAKLMPEDEFLASLKDQAPDISGPNRWNAPQLLSQSDIAKHAVDTLGLESTVLPNGQVVSSVGKRDYQALMDPAGLRAVDGLTWVTDESSAQLDSRAAGSLDQLMSVSPNLVTVRQNQDVIAQNRARMANWSADGAEPRDLTAELDRAMKWFGNDGPLERLRHDEQTMTAEDRIAIAGLTQVSRSMEAQNLTPAIQRDMGKVMDGLKPVVDDLESRRGIVMAAADSGLRDNLVTLSEASDIKGEGAPTAAAALERHQLVQKLADVGKLDPQLVKPAIAPGVFDTQMLNKQVLRLNEASTPQIQDARAAQLSSAGEAVINSDVGFPSPAHHQRAQQRLAELPPNDRKAVLNAAGTTAMAKQSLDKDRREVDALWERASGGPADALAAERGDLTAVRTQVGAMEKGFLHLLSRPGVSNERLLSAAEALSRLDTTAVEPRSVVPTDQKLNPVVGTGVDFARTYMAAVAETKPALSFSAGSAPAITDDLRTSLGETANRAAPEALRKGLERVERCSPELGKYVHEARLRLGPAGADEPDRITQSRTGLDNKLIELGQLDSRTKGRWIREEGTLLQDITGDAREAHKATQRPSSAIQKITDKIGHEFAKQDLAVGQQGARHHVEQDMGIGDYIEAAVKGVGKGVSQHLRGLVNRVHSLEPRAPEQNAAPQQNAPLPHHQPAVRHQQPGV